MFYNYISLLVDAGNRAVIFDKFRGIQPKSVGEGTHFKIPFVQVNFLILFFLYILKHSIMNTFY